MTAPLPTRAKQEQAGTNLRRFKPYPTYNDSGVDWLGEIPAHWDVAPVYARYKVELGKMLDAKRITGEASGRYLRNVDVQWDTVNVDALPEMDFAPPERYRYQLRVGDLLVCEGGEVGRTAIWRGEISECFYQKAIHRVRPHLDSETPRFFYYLMFSLAKRGLFVSEGNSNTIDHLTATQLRHYRFPFAPSPEQRAIAAFLDRETTQIDALVEKKEQLIALLQEQRATLVARAVTRGIEPKAAMKESGVEWLGQVPAHWQVRRLKYLASLNEESLGEDTDPDLEIVYVDIGSVDSLGRIVKRESLTFGSAPSRARRQVRDGDVIVSTVRTYLRAIAPIIDPPPSLVVSTGFAVVRPFNGLTTAYTAYTLRAPYFVERVVANSKGVSFPAINESEMAAYMLAVPPPREQRAIAAFLNRETARIDALMARVQDAIDRLQELRTALISAAVTGKIDVREEIA